VTDLSILQQVRKLQIRTNRQVANVLAGAYLSVFKGSGIEFDEVRPYVPGDDIRAIDWNVTARTGEPYVKRFVEERELTIMIMVDISGSQDFGVARSKRELASELAALLAFSAASNKDKVGLMLFHRDSELFIPPRKGQKHAMRVVREILSRQASAPKSTDLPWRKRWLRFWKKRGHSPGKGTDIGGSLEFCRRVLKKRAVLFVISDFHDIGYLPTLQRVNKRHDVVAALIRDPGESQLPTRGLVALRDAETGRERLIDASDRHFREALMAMSNARTESLKSSLQSSGIDLMILDNDKPAITPLLSFLRMREKRGRR